MSFHDDFGMNILEYDESALCMFRTSELSKFFGSSCSSSRPAMDYTSEALLTTKAQSFDADVKKDALRVGKLISPLSSIFQSS